MPANALLALIVLFALAPSLAASPQYSSIQALGIAAGLGALMALTVVGAVATRGVAWFAGWRAGPEARRRWQDRTSSWLAGALALLSGLGLLGAGGELGAAHYPMLSRPFDERAVGVGVMACLVLLVFHLCDSCKGSRAEEGWRWPAARVAAFGLAFWATTFIEAQDRAAWRAAQETYYSTVNRLVPVASEGGGTTRGEPAPRSWTGR